MGYAFMHIDKIKTTGNMVSKFNHNYRKEQIDNVIPGMEHLNEELIPLPAGPDGSKMDYAEAFRDRMNSLSYYSDHRIKSNQVLGYEVLLTYSRDESVDVEEWKTRCVDWLHKTFDHAGDGRSNVLSAVFHGDETGNVHIHAFIVPIDERGRLNATRYTNGSRQMSLLNDSYADAVKDLGLERGLAGSSAQHKTIRKMYADLNHAKNSVPDPLPGESAADYKKRIIEQAETLYIAGMRKADDYMVKTRRNADQYRINSLNEARAEIQEEKEMIMGTMKAAEMKRDKLNEEIQAYQKEMDALAQQMYDIKIKMNVTDETLDNAVKAKRIQTGIELISREDPERAERMEQDLDYAIAKAQARELDEIHYDNNRHDSL